MDSKVFGYSFEKDPIDLDRHPDSVYQCGVHVYDVVSVPSDEKRCYVLDTYADIVSNQLGVPLIDSQVNCAPTCDFYSNGPIQLAVKSFDADSLDRGLDDFFVFLKRDSGLDVIGIGVSGDTSSVRDVLSSLSDCRNRFVESCDFSMSVTSVLRYEGNLFVEELEDSSGNYLKYDPVRCFDTLLLDHSAYLDEVLQKSIHTEYEQLSRQDCEAMKDLLDTFDLKPMSMASSSELDLSSVSHDASRDNSFERKP